MLASVLAALVIRPDSARSQADPAVLPLAGLLSADSLRATVERLERFYTRFVGSDSSRAAGSWLRDRLVGAGWNDTRFDSFAVTLDKTIGGRRFLLEEVTARNIVAVRHGVLHRDRFLVLGAHYDSVNLGGADLLGTPDTTYAPGANDNASGVAAVLEIARLLSGVELDMSLVLVLFDGEELGLWGSREYALRARERGDEVVGMFSLDALGTRSTEFPNAFSLDASSRSLSIAQEVAQAASDYTELSPRSRFGPGPIELVSSAGREGCGCSDHQSFLDQGYPGVGVFQYLGAGGAFHTRRDAVGAVDFAQVLGIGRAVLGAALRIAGFPGRSPDFDGSEFVDLEDFFLFAVQFGKRREDPGFESRFDLDRNNEVGISDFFLFVNWFGKKM